MESTNFLKLDKPQFTLIPLHPAQQEVYYDQITHINSSHYNLGGYFVLKGQIDKDRLRLVLKKLPEVFDVFRLRFDFTEEEPYCYFSGDPEEDPVEELDFSTSTGPRENALAWMQAQFNKTFDLTGPLFEHALLKIGENEHWLFGRYHHLITDGYGFTVCSQYIANTYSSLTGPTQEPLLLKYFPYEQEIIKGHEYIGSESYLKDAAYWKSQFTEVPDPLFKKRYRAGQSDLSQSKTIVIEINRQQNELVSQLISRTGNSLQQLTLAALSIYFARTENRQEIIFGIPVHNRRNKAQRTIMGMFAGMVPYKGFYSPELLLSEYLQQVKLQQRNDYRHQSYPISHLNRELKLLASGRSQIFDVAVNYAFLDFELTFSGLESETYDMASESGKYPLQFWWRDYGKQQPLQLRIDYHLDYFSKEEAEQLAEQLLFMLEQFPEALNKRTGDIEIVSEKERSNLLELSNPAAIPWPENKALTDLFEDQAVKYPDATALSFNNERLTYRELSRRTNQLARFLQKKGVKEENLVPICADRSLEMIVGLLGILKSGAAYVPLDPTYPEERLRFILEDTRASIVLGTESVKDLLLSAGVEDLVLLDSNRNEIENESSEAPEIKPEPSGLAYVIYTSGSTGRPKGVLTEHKSVVNLISHQTSEFGIQQEEKILQLSNYAFDASVEQIFLALCNGAGLVLVPKETLLDPDRLVQLIQEKEVTHLHATPALLNQLSPGKYGSLKRVIAGGEACPVSLAKAWEHYAAFYNEYGPTETTITATEYLFSSEKYSGEKLVSIGKPVANTPLYITDSEGMLVPKGATGELCIGGVQVARGYLNRPELTEEKFIADPFSGKQGGRLYKTGDLVRWLPDGNLEYLGRIDDQVKIRGYRIEPGEVESALSQCEGVKEAVVLARKDASGHNSLFGFVVPEGLFDRNSIISQLKDRLPAYMVPAVITEIGAIPLTGNGKIDKKALPDVGVGESLSSRYVAPRNETEEKLAVLWQELLGHERVGVRDNFFELGGHSLLAVRLLSRLRKAFRVELQIKDIFSNPTISGLALELATKESGNLLPAVIPVDRSRRLPLSFSQERLWFIDQLEGSSHYHLPAVYRLQGELDKNALEEAFQQIVRRHEVLRTVIRQEDGKGYQQVLDTNFHLNEVSSDSFADEKALKDFIKATIEEPFDLSDDLMLRVVLVKNSAQEHLLVVVLHHIAADGWSVQVLPRDLMDLYEAGKDGSESADLVPLAVQYGDYAVWQRKNMRELQAAQLAYWKEKLNGVTELNLPLDFTRPAKNSHAGGMVSLKLDRNTANKLDAFAKKEEVTQFTCLLAVLKVLLFRYSGQQDVCVGIPVAGRRLPELEPLIGFFVNSLAIRTAVDPEQSFQKLLNEVKETTMDAYEHQDVPFEKVVEAMGVAREMNRSPLFQVMFSFQDAPAMPAVELNNLSFKAEPTESITAKFDLSFFAVVNGDGFEISVEYSKDLFKASTAERMLQHFRLLLNQLLDKPDVETGQAEFLTEEEHEQLIKGYNATAAAFPQEETLISLFEAQAAKTPDAVAVRDGQESLSYRQLDSRANQLAHYLRKRGVKEESLVPVCMDRSMDLVTALLGIQKAGGAYVPVDPSYPKERIQYMLEDTGAMLVLGSSEYSGILREEVSEGTASRELILLDTDRELIVQEPDVKPSVELQPSSLAYVIYTSGSTGKPKGVLVEQRGVVNLCSWHINEYGLSGESRSTMMAGVGFDASAWEVWPVLLSGAGLHIVADEQRLEVEKLMGFFQERGITHSFVPTALVDQLVKQEQPNDLALQYVLTGGDQLRTVSTAHLNWKLVNHYGPTENSVVATAYTLKENEAGLPPIGKPISNTTAYVLDKSGKPVPQGVAGELCIGGVQVARGYLNRPELTAEKFVQDPFSDNADARIYKTGDLVRWQEDGNLEFLGRIDDQVKIRGYRIELGEIESVLQQCEGVKQAVVIAKADASGNKRLIGYVVPETEGAFDREIITNEMKRKLPDYMVPAVFVELEEIPLTANGKVNKKALPEVEAGDGLTSFYVAPRSETEEKLVDIWQELLQLERVGVEDNFFELGGDSIITIQLVSRAKRAGFSFQPRDVFEHQTIAALAGVVQQEAAIKTEQGVLTGPAGLLPIQQWFFEQDFEEPDHFNQSVLLQIKKSVTLQQLDQALFALSAQHDALRFVYQKQENGWEQQYGEFLEEKAGAVKIVLEESGGELLSKEITGVCEAYQKNLDLSTDRLTSFVLMETPETETHNRLLLVIHHLAVDGVSWRVLLEDLEASLQALNGDKEVLQGQKTSSYRQWQEALQHYGDTKAVRQLPYWEKIAKTGFTLPTDHKSDGAIFVADQKSFKLPLDSLLTQALLTEVHQTYHTEINDLLLAALAKILSDYTNQDQVLIALEGHGREDISAEIEISRTVGWFTNLYPVLLKPDSSGAASGLLQSVKEQLREVPDKGLGFGVLRYMHPDKEVRQKLQNLEMEVVFNYLGRLDNAINSSNWFAPALESSGASTGNKNHLTAKLDISASVVEGQLQTEWRYSSKLYTEATIENMAGAFIKELTRLIIHCQEQPVSQLTPSDYGLTGKVGYRELEDFLETKHHGQPLREQVSSVYSLSPMQEGLLFHGLYDQESPAYMEQLSCRLTGLKPDAFRKSWDYLLRQHTILRTSFHQEMSVPVQCVHDNVKLPFELLDFSGFTEAEQQAELNAFRKKDLKKGFDFRQPPLMRLTLIRLNEEVYQMIWTHHHLLLDGWSMPVLMHELLTTYDLLSAGKEPVPQKEDQYEDFIRYLQQKDPFEAEDFWKGYLSGLEDPVLLPFVDNSAEKNGDRTKGGEEYRQVRLLLVESAHEDIQKYCQSRHLTVNTLVQGVWAYLLSSYSGQDDAVFGVTVAGRPSELEGAETRLGLYINTIPLRSHISTDQSVTDWLLNLQEEHSAAREHAHTPLSAIQQWQGIKGELFDTLLVFENYPMGEVLSQNRSLKVEAPEMDEHTNYPLSIIAKGTKQLSVDFSYNTALLSDEQVRKIKTHFEEILQQIIYRPDIKLSELELVGEEEKLRLTQEFNATASLWPYDRNLVSLFEEQAAKTPDAVAIVQGEDSLTYRQLHIKSNQLARYLQNRGVGIESLVPVCLERSTELVAALLGILKAGGAYVPVDPSYPKERIRYMLEDTGASLVLSSSAFKDIAEGEKHELVLLDSVQEQIAKEATEDLDTSIMPSNLAYVIYTSGSTGQPKGVLVEHKGVVNLCSWHIREYSLSGESRSTMMAGTGFDASAWEVWPVLLSGASLHIVDNEQRLEPEKLLSFYQKNGITHSFVPTAIIDQLVRQKQPEGLALKYVLTGGDQLRTFSTAHLSWKLVNHYGPTENSVVATSYILTSGETAMPPIGKPISNTTAYVLDKAGKLVPEGIAGELCIGGVQVARGYLNREVLTAEKFVKDPFSREKNAIMYKTGDLVRWLPNGNLEFLGRTDEQVKIRGYRIEPGEVESVLCRCKGVKQAVVVAKTDASGNKQLLGYVVADGPYKREAITDELKLCIPDYMVPAVLVELDEIPLTANGKVDKKALPEVEASEVLSTIYVAPRNETEKKLAAIWQELLKTERIGAEDNFFELGGHSLLATRMVSSVRKSFGAELQIKDVFVNPTLAGIARQLQTKNTTEAVLPPIAACNFADDEKVPLSYAQERLWFIDQLQGSSHYHLPAVFRLTGEIDIEGFEESFRQIVERHEALRTVFLQEDNKVYQQVIDAHNWELSFMDADDFIDPAGIQTFIQKTMQQSFDLSKDYMLRAVLLRISPEEHLMLVVLHHIASDGWSVSVLVKELAELYGAQQQNRKPLLPELVIQYRDYAVWQRDYLQGKVLEEQTNYWQQKLAGQETLQLPTDFVRPSIQSIRGGRIELKIDKKLSQKLEEFSGQEGVTLFMSLLSAFKVLLYRYSGQEDICVGSPIAGRVQPEIEPLIGFFVNTLALRSRPEGKLGFRDLLKQVKATTLEAYSHQDLPFEKVVEAVGVARDMSRSPLFQVMFSLQNTPPVPSVDLGGLSFSPEDLSNPTTKYDLTLDVTNKHEGLHLNVEYCSDLFRESTVMRMMDHYRQLLSELTAAPDLPLDQIPLLNTSERKQLLEGFNDTTFAYPEDKTLVTVFEEQVAKNPDSVAVVFEGEELTYEQLNRRANQLAHYLWSKGVEKESLVPICVDRSLLMVTGLLGVLKAGAAYVPLDPSFPQERIQYMLKDSGAKLVLGSSKYAEMILGEEKRELVLLDTDWDKIAEEPATRPTEQAGPSNLAYVIYTSGSTGKPKGVLIEHGSLVNFLYAMAGILETDQETDLLAVTTYSFDISYLELYLPMLTGGKVIIASKESAADGFLLQEILAAYSPALMQATPATWKLLLDSGWENKEEVTVLVGGEAVREDLKDSLTAISPKVWNMYGPTETTIWSSCKELKTGEKVTIGKPIANTRCYILDKAGDPAPVGVAGELCIGGAGLARAYLNRPDLTAERFIPDPFNREPGARMYRTGDLARWLPNGEIEYLSRMDDQVKIRGYRIELGEIETVLQQCHTVSQGVVAAKTDPNGNKKLVGYVVPKDSFQKEAILAHLRAKLPNYMVPSIILGIEELPLTPNGKVDRKALPEPDVAELLADQYVAPRTETEEKLAKMWQDLLKLERVGVKDNFFESGGDSLLVVRIVSLIRQEFSLDIPVNTLFKFSCIADLADYIEAVSQNDTEQIEEDSEDIEVFEL